MSPTYTIAKDDVKKLVHSVRDEFDVFGPAPKRGMHVFTELDDVERLDLTYENTMMSPKKYLLPPEEVMMHFDLKEKSVEDTVNEIKSTKTQLLLGVHNCDIHGLLFLDKVFGGTYDDPYYQARKENTVIVGLNCMTPCKFGFCRSMNTHEVIEGYDLYLSEIAGEKYYVHVGTLTGDKLISRAPDLFKKATKDDIDAFKTAMSQKQKAFPLELSLDTITETFDLGWEDPIWEEIGELCMNCGSCSLVCPTCYCYDVKDDVNLSITSADRTRRWSNCLYHDFALVAGPHNFRGSRPARLKYRFYHKLNGAVREQGMIACTGCGRCHEHCPADISILDTLRKLQENWAAVPPLTGGK
jgi:ferredoxin